MGRRNKNSALEELLDAVAELPWWAGLLLAGASFVAFQWLSHLRPAVGEQGYITLTIVSAFSLVLRVAVPGVCVMAAIISLVRRAHGRRLADEALSRSDASLTAGLGWREFERLIGEGFRRRGYQVAETGGGGPDGGVDLMLDKDGERGLVQCKHWRASSVGVEVVRELYGLMTARGAVRGFVVTSGRYSNAAREFASGRNVELIDGTGLRELLRDSRAGAAADKDAVDEAFSATRSPVCPHCKSTMVRRTASRGQHAGRPFWGCSRFPDCRAIVADE